MDLTTGITIGAPAVTIIAALLLLLVRKNNNAKSQHVNVNTRQGNPTSHPRRNNAVTPRECDARHQGLEHRLGEVEVSVKELREDVQSTRNVADEILAEVKKNND